MSFKAVFLIGFFSLSFLPFQAECAAVPVSTFNMKMQKKVKSIREIRDQNVVRQTTDYSCGAAGLATILNYGLHDPINEQEIIMEMLKSVDLQKVKERKGFSLLDLKRFSEQRGYKATGYKMDIEFLRKLDRVVLVPIKFKNYRHFVIVKDVIGDRVFVADPAMGNMVMKVHWFKKVWQDGIGLVIEDPTAQTTPSLLNVSPEDMIFVDGKRIKRMSDPSVLRTAVFPTEF